METHVRYAIVGAFVVVMTAMIVLAIIWLSSGFYTTHDYTMYKVYMRESVTGLSLDAPVEYNGVRVGKVADIQIDPIDSRTVDLFLRVKKTTPVSLATRAKLDVRSLSGIAYIGLDDDGTSKTLLTTLPGEKYPVIETKPSIYMRVDKALTELNSNFTKLSESINSLLSQDNIQSINAILQTSENTMRVLQTQTLPEFNQTVSRIDELTSKLSTVTDEIKQNPSVLIRGKQQTTVLGPGEK